MANNGRNRNNRRKNDNYGNRGRTPSQQKDDRASGDDRGRIEKVVGDERSRWKKLTHGIFYAALYFAPYLTLDLFRLPILGHLTKYLIGVPCSKIGNFLHDSLGSIPILGFISKRAAHLLWLLEPLGQVEIFGLEFFIEEGIKKAAEKLIIMYWDNILDLIVGLGTAGIGGAVTSYLTFMFDGEIWKIAEDWGIDEKIVEYGPELTASIASAFLMKKYGDENEETADPNKFQHNGQTVMSDGSGRNRNTRWNELEQEDDEGYDIGRVTSKLSGLPALLLKAIPVLLILGAIGGGILMFSGGGYGGLLGDMFGSETSQATNAGSDIVESASFQGSKFMKTIQCFTEGAGCIKEWQLNNTREPGSEDVGESYRLRVQDFSVFGADSSFDVAYQTPDSDIPISFLLKNTRHQLKGIDAKNVSYRVRITETEFLSASKDQCNSDWVQLQKYGDNPDINFGPGNKNDWLLPGESAEPLNWQGNSANLKDCGLLQPGPSESFDVLLEVRYNYSSHSLLSIDAMSNQHRNEENTQRESKNSQAVDTPVQSYIVTRNPMTYSEINGDRISRPQQVQVGVSTDEDGISYKVDPDSFNFTDSDLTSPVDDDCPGLDERNGEDNTFGLSKNATEDITERQANRWFDRRSSAVSAFCNFELANPDEISATGETLTFTAEADYQIEMAQHRTSFQVRNTLCSFENCPMLKPVDGNLDNVATTNLDEAPPSSDNYREKEYALCNRPQDAQDGCSVLENGFTNREVIDDLTIEDGDIAVTEDAIKGSDSFTCHVKDTDFNQSVFGFDPEDLTDAVQGNELMNYTENDWDLVESEEGSSSSSCA